MAGWTGFTDEDLRVLKNGNKPEAQFVSSAKPAKVGQQQRKKVREEMMPQSHSKPRNVEPDDKNDDASGKSNNNLSNRRQDVPVTETLKPMKVDKDNQDALKQTTGSSSENDASRQDKTQPENTGRDTKQEIGILSDEKVAELQLSHLELLQKKQKEIEDENKKKRQLIKSTVQERLKKTQQEAQTLKFVQKELALIDQKLQADVENLRNRIDDSSFELAHAQKRYERAETEYVAAKLDLHHKREVKDELTEQLYAIIQENELRKAKKLEEIMSRLHVDESSDVSSVSNPSSPSSSTPANLTGSAESSVGMSDKSDNLPSPSSPNNEDSSVDKQSTSHNGESSTVVLAADNAKSIS